MAAYSGAVTKADRGPVPENFEEKPHHITKHGKVVGFKNTHPSFGPGVSPFMLTLRILR